MFTGIVRATGTVADLRPQGGDLRLRIESADMPWTGYSAGESIAVSGVCLTAGRIDAKGFDCDVSRETLRVTTLGDLRAGQAVNLEPPLALGDRLGGHLVSGHVDGVATVSARHDDARSIALTISVPAALRRYVARKGSVCIDGVSLTINEVSGDGLTVNIIPHTAQSTTLGACRPGTRVNVEVDMIARYLERLAGFSEGGRDGEAPGTGRIDRSFLKAHGYA